MTTRGASAQTAREVLRSASSSGPGFAFVATAARSHDLARLLDLVRRGRLRVPVDRVFPMDRIADAHRYAESREVRGKVVVTVA